MITPLLLAAALWLDVPATAPAAPASADVRGLWVVRTALVSPEMVDETLQRAEAAGVNTLFVQVRGRGDAFYRSSLVPRSILLERQSAAFDPLDRLLRGARARRMSVHAWFNVLLTAGHGSPLPAGHVLRTHPEWLMVPRSAARQAWAATGAGVLRAVAGATGDNESEGFYLSPSAPGVAEHLAAAARELVTRYPVDGLHLDFIRLPGPEFDYSRWAVDGFRAQGGRGDPLSWAGNARWSEFRRAAVGNLVRRIGAAARQARPGLLLSAAVMPDIAQAREHRFQDWTRWSASGLLDVVCPMAYTPDDRIFSSQVAAASAALPPSTRLWAGIGAYRLDVAGVKKKVRLARAAGAAGVVLFSHEWLAQTEGLRLDAPGADAISRAIPDAPSRGGAP